ncbi:MAG: hypothetical protein ABSB42_16980 [Tepidisphaeraceae bacterium]|jgi:hypothetical protein
MSGPEQDRHGNDKPDSESHPKEEHSSRRLLKRVIHSLGQLCRHHKIEAALWFLAGTFCFAFIEENMSKPWMLYVVAGVICCLILYYTHRWVADLNEKTISITPGTASALVPPSPPAVSPTPETQPATTMNAETASLTVHPPVKKFTIRQTDFSFRCGDHGMTMGWRLDDNGNSPTLQLVTFGGAPGPLSVTVNNWIPSVNCCFSDGINLVRLKDSVLFDPPDGWDQNGDENAMEVVDEKSRPVFQLIKIKPNEVLVHGVFSLDTKRVALLTNVAEIILNDWGSVEIARNRLRPIFKYPSEINGGVRAKDSSRRLSDKQKETLADLAKAFRGRKVVIWCEIGDGEGWRYAQDFSSVFENAGVDCHGTVSGPMKTALFGVEVVANEKPEQKTGEFAVALLAWLEANGVQTINARKGGGLGLTAEIPKNEVYLRVAFCPRDDLPKEEGKSTSDSPASPR